jgi:hypothetical protein
MARRRAGGVCRGCITSFTRRNQRQDIRDDQDRTKYLEILANLKTLYSFRIPSYVFDSEPPPFAFGCEPRDDLLRGAQLTLPYPAFRMRREPDMFQSQLICAV